MELDLTHSVIKEKPENIIFVVSDVLSMFFCIFAAEK